MTEASEIQRLRAAAFAREAERLERIRILRAAASTAVCLHCGSDALSEEGRFSSGGADYHVDRCDGCGISQLDRQMSLDEVSRLEDKNPHYQSEDEDVEAMINAHSFIVELIERFVPRGRLLEVGCSKGYKLEAARRAGWEVQGIELSPRSNRFARDVLGVPIHEGSLDDYAPQTSFQAVVGWHVLEHVPSIPLFLGLIHACTSPGGHVFIQVPSYGLYRDRSWPDHVECFNAVHYWYFTTQSLEARLEEAGFKSVFRYDDERTLHLTVVAQRA